MRHAHVLAPMLLTVLVPACATRYLPPPRAPSRYAPAVEVAPPPLRDGEGTITLDVTTGPARAELITGRTQVHLAAQGWGGRPRYGVSHWGTQLTTRPLCITPCAVNLPLGSQELSFAPLDESSNASGTGFVQVGARPSVVRHTMGFQETHVGAMIASVLLSAFGVSALTSGIALAAIGSGSSPHASDVEAPGFITLVVGVGLLAAGIGLGVTHRPEVQPGATTQWTP